MHLSLTSHFQVYGQLPETFLETKPEHSLLAATERLASGSTSTVDTPPQL